MIGPRATACPTGPDGMDAGRESSDPRAALPDRSGRPMGGDDWSGSPWETVTGTASVGHRGSPMAAISGSCTGSTADPSGTPNRPEPERDAPGVSGPSGGVSRGSTPGASVVADGSLAPHALERIGCQAGSTGTGAAARSARVDQTTASRTAGSPGRGRTGRSGTAGSGGGGGRIPTVDCGPPPGTATTGSGSPASTTGAEARRAPEIMAAKDASIAVPSPDGDSAVRSGPETGLDNATRGSIPGKTEGIMASWRWGPGGAGPRGSRRLWPLRRRSWPGRRGWPHSGRPSSG